MAMPSSRSMGSIRSDAMGPTSQRSRLRSQQKFSSSSMTPVPSAACCKQRRYGDRSPASYTSIRSTTFVETPDELLKSNRLVVRHNKNDKPQHASEHVKYRFATWASRGQIVID